MAKVPNTVAFIVVNSFYSNSSGIYYDVIGIAQILKLIMLDVMVGR